MTRGAWVALGVVGIIASGAGLYYFVLRPGAGSSGARIGAGGTAPPPTNTSPETTWGGRLTTLADEAKQNVSDVVDFFHKFA